MELQFNKLPRFSQLMSILLTLITDTTYHVLDINLYSDSTVSMEDVYQELQHSSTPPTPAISRRLEVFSNTVLQHLSRIVRDLQLEEAYLLPRISLLLSTFTLHRSIPYIDPQAMQFLVLCLVRVLAALDEKRLEKFDPQYSQLPEFRQHYRSYFWFPYHMIDEYCQRLRFSRRYLDSVPISFRL
uniref:Putative DNA primase small subunit n=1 Tax=Lygus hesperus TaxID=30085 RepID=A0A0A9W5D2_LYGHE